jgi:hypothetical protein
MIFKYTFDLASINLLKYVAKTLASERRMFGTRSLRNAKSGGRKSQLNAEKLSALFSNIFEHKVVYLKNLQKFYCNKKFETKTKHNVFYQHLQLSKGPFFIICKCTYCIINKYFTILLFI